MKQILLIFLISFSSLVISNDILLKFDSTQSFDINLCEEHTVICKPFQLKDENNKFSQTIYRRIFRCFAYGEEIYLTTPEERKEIYTTEQDCLDESN